MSRARSHYHERLAEILAESGRPPESEEITRLARACWQRRGRVDLEVDARIEVKPQRGFDERLQALLAKRTLVEITIDAKDHWAARKPRRADFHLSDGSFDSFLADEWAEKALWDARKRAKKRGCEFDLSAAFVLRMLMQQGTRCAVSGIHFNAWWPEGAHKRPFMPSLDRIDSRRGYTQDNVRIVCVAINTLLQDWGDFIFDEILRAARP